VLRRERGGTTTLEGCSVHGSPECCGSGFPIVPMGDHSGTRRRYAVRAKTPFSCEIRIDSFYMRYGERPQAHRDITAQRACDRTGAVRPPRRSRCRVRRRTRSST
jgi:hypothetical protein